MTEAEGNNEMNLFKEEIYKLIRETEAKLLNQITTQKSQTATDLESFSNKINTIIENNKSMVLSVVSQKIKCEKIAELETFKNKVDGMLITHEVRINTSLDEIEKMKTKYDKITSDNLLLPGFVGPSCQFQTMANYVAYNINEVSKLKNEKEQLKKDAKDMKIKIDNLLKSMVSLCDNSVQRCKEYTDNKQKSFENVLEVKLKEFNEKSLEMRSTVVKFQQEINDKILELKTEFEKLINMKNEFLNLIENKYIEFDQKCTDLNNKIDSNIENMTENITTNKNKLTTIETHSNEIDTKIKDLFFQVRNYYCVNNKIVESLKVIGININNPHEIAKFLQKQNSQKNNIRDNIYHKTSNIFNLNNHVQKLGKYEILEEDEFRPTRVKRRASVSFKPEQLGLDENNGGKNSENNNKKKKYFPKSAFKEKNNNNRPKPAIINLDFNNKKTINLELNESSSSETPTKKNNCEQTTNDAKVETEKNQKNVMLNVLSASEEKTKKQCMNLFKCSKSQTHNEVISRDKLQTEGNRFTKINNINDINDNINNIKTLNLNFNSSPDITASNNIINTNTYHNVNNRSSLSNSIKNKVKFKLKINEKKIEEESNFCKYVKLDLPIPKPITEDEFIRQTINDNNIKSNNIYIFNNKLELPPCSLKVINKARNFSKNAQGKKINMIGELMELPKKMNHFFGKTTHSFYFKKPSKEYPKNIKINHTVDEKAHELQLSQRNEKKGILKKK